MMNETSTFVTNIFNYKTLAFANIFKNTENYYHDFIKLKLFSFGLSNFKNSSTLK